MDERSFVTKDETSGKTLTSNSRTARLGTRSFQFMVKNHSYFRAEGNQSKERKPALVSGARFISGFFFHSFELDFEAELDADLKSPADLPDEFPFFGPRSGELKGEPV